MDSRREAGPADTAKTPPERLPRCGTYLHGRRLFGVEAPGKLFLLGTDGYGRDVLSRVLYGGRVSLLTGLLAAALAVGFGRDAGYCRRVFRRLAGRSW